jgi:hypothetical protein
VRAVTASQPYHLSLPLSLVLSPIATRHLCVAASATALLGFCSRHCLWLRAGDSLDIWAPRPRSEEIAQRQHAGCYPPQTQPHGPYTTSYLSRAVSICPKQQRRLRDVDRPADKARALNTIPHNSSISHAGILNSNYVTSVGAAIPRYTAIRFSDCISSNDAQTLLDLLQDLKDAKMKFQTTPVYSDKFRQLWIRL